EPFRGAAEAGDESETTGIATEFRAFWLTRHAMAMNINKYTEKAREAVATAIELAQQNNNPQLEPEHLLVALVEQREGIVPELLRKMNVDPAAVARGGRDLLKKLPQAYGGAQPGMSSRFNLVTDKAQVEADHLKDEYVSTEHLFVAIADESGRSPGAQLLK